MMAKIDIVSEDGNGVIDFLILFPSYSIKS